MEHNGNAYEEVFNSLEIIAKRNSPQNPNDYIGDDGLLYCGNCHTPKQCKVNILDAERTVYCMCKCATEQRNEQERRAKANRLRKEGFTDARLIDWNFDKDDLQNERLSKIARNYVENFEKFRNDGKGLLLFGTTGTGKTFLAACIANALIDKLYPCIVTNFARVANDLSNSFSGKQEYIDNLNRCDLLVLDDIASERDTEYMGEIVQSIIDSRYLSGRPLIVTTNLTAEELKNPADIRKQRIYSRLFEMCIPVEVSGADRRREKLKTDFSEYSDILGLKD